MNFKKKLREIAALTRKPEGFTLVELIVVIAILGILAGVGTVGYSGYIKKANMAADQTLASEVAHALELGYYSGIITEGGYVVLKNEAAPEASDNSTVGSAMAAVFGDSWDDEGNETMMLKYDGWNGAYNGSSFQGKETTLLTRVEGLTEVLSETLSEHPELMGSTFQEYAADLLGISLDEVKTSENAAAVADAAVLYVAQGTANVDEEAFKSVVASAPKGDLSAMLNKVTQLYGGSSLMGAAASYAVLTGFAEYMDYDVGEISLTAEDGTELDPSNPEHLPRIVFSPFYPLFQTEDDNEKWEEYCEAKGGMDAAAFIAAMGTANGAKSLVMDDLGKTNCFASTKLQELFNAYGDDNVVVLLEVMQDGSFDVYSVPSLD